MHRLSLRLVPRSSGGRGALLLLIAVFLGLRLAGLEMVRRRAVGEREPAIEPSLPVP